MTNNEIVFDEKSGISVEEQQEIMSQINGIAEKNKKSLSENAANLQSGIKKTVINAKKSGIFFPLAVNIAAIAVIAAGVVLLILHNGRVDSQVRIGSAVFNLTERTLIEEIRKDTQALIAAKEMEIASIASRLGEVDEELFLLYSSNVTLTSEQITARERLLVMQESFRGELSVLQEERSQILEASRTREARLRTQLEERTREFAAAQQRTAGELDSAVEELNRLSNEQERLAAIDAQIAGGISLVSSFIQNARYEEALHLISNLRDFANNNAVASLRSFQSRREFYNQTLNLMEVMISDARRNSGTGGGAEQFELQSQNLQLQETITSMQRTIDTFNAGSAGQAGRISELETAANTLRRTISSLEQTSAEKDARITSLQNENTNLSSTVTELRAANTANEQEVANLRNQLTIIRQALVDN
jgi:uncharacterized protein YdcH (DUF465 family)